MNLIGFLRLSTAISIWMLGCFILPITLICLFFHIYFPLYFIILYYTIRYFFPAKEWPFIVKLLQLNASPYCNSQKIIFEDGAKAPEPNSKTMIALSPHGILTIGWMMMISSDELIPSRCKWLVAEILAKLPFVSDLNTWSNIVSCGKNDMIEYMSKGINVGLIPGGFEEASIYKYSHNRVYLKTRKGFIKYALQYGYKVQVCYVFGEELTYWQLNLPHSIALWLNKYKIPATIFIGKFFFLPNNDIDITVVISKPIQLPHIESPTNEDVDKYHAIYLKEIEALYERNKSKYSVNKDQKLEIF